MKKAIYLRKGLFETRNKFEDRINTVLELVSQNLTLLFIEICNRAVIIGYNVEEETNETEIKKPVKINGFK